MPPEMDPWKQLIISTPIGGALLGCFYLFLTHLRWKEQNQNANNERLGLAIEKLADATDRNTEAVIRLSAQRGVP